MSQLQLKSSTSYSERVRASYKKKQSLFLSTDPYDKDMFLNKIDNLEISSYMGKGRHRTLIKEDIRLYKSIIHYTNFFLTKSPAINWVERLLICKNRLNIDKTMLCRCGQRSTFDKQTQNFTKMFCRSCYVSSCSKEWFKIKYGDNWKEEYTIFHSNLIRQERKRVIGRKSWYIRKGRAFNGCLCKGKNETKILDFIQSKYNIDIERGIEVNGYCVDGYCRDNNTVYEVYEKYHHYQLEYDTRRKDEIMNYLKCDFVIIFDNNETILEELTFKKYAQT